MTTPEIGGAVRRSVLLSFAGRYGAVPLRLAAMLALARLLSPAEFGAHATALAAVTLLGVAADIGASHYLVRAERVEEADRRAALGLGLLLAGGAATLLVAAGLLLPSRWLGPGVGATLAVGALTLPLGAMIAVLSAPLHRALRFGPIAAAGVLGAAVFAGSAVALAAAGFGPVSLAAANVAELLAVLLLLGRHERLPRPALAGWRTVFGFGRVWAAIGAMRQAGDALCRLAVGALLGLGPLGLLTRAQAAVGLFDKALLDAVSPVVLPALAAAQRAGRPAAPVYLAQVGSLAALAWPFFGALALLAEPVVAVLFGPGWEAAVPLLRWLCLAGLFLPMAALTLPWLVAAGMLGAWVPVQAGLQAGRVVAVALAALHSLELAAVALAMEAAAKAICAQRLIGRHLGLDHWALAGTLLRAAVPAGAALAAVTAVAIWLGFLPAPLLLVAAGVAGIAAWLPALLLAGHPLAAEIHRAARAFRSRILLARPRES